MSNYNNLKTSIDANIKQNGNQEITGPILNSVLNQMVNILGTGYQFAGVATLDPATDPGTPDAKVFYIANGKGTYTNFGGLELTEDEVVVLYWDTAWHKVATGIASQAKLSELERISTYQEEYVLSTPNSVLDKYFVNPSGTIESSDSYHIDLYKLEANKKYIIRRKVEWSGIYLGFVCIFEPQNFIAGGTVTNVICGSTTTIETEVSYEQDTYISILSNIYRGTFYEIATFINNGSADLKKEVDNISEKMISIESNVRRKLLIKRADNNVQLYEKMLQAHEMGNTDVCFETGTYELTEIYSYMKNTLGYTSMYEMQIGNGCRYYLNGSTIISKHVDGIPDTDRSVFGTRMKSTDYEIYDGILITDGGHYVVHDDTQNYEQQYRHVYKNITFKTSNDDGHRIPEAPLGCGTGKFVDIIFEDCIFESLIETDFFCHGIVNDTSHQTVTLRLTFSNCFFSGFVGLSSYLTNEDDIKLVVNNCSLGRADTIQHENKCKYLHVYNNQVRDS